MEVHEKMKFELSLGLPRSPSLAAAGSVERGWQQVFEGKRAPEQHRDCW